MGTVTADNASNVLAAFKISNLDVDHVTSLTVEDDGDEEPPEIMLDTEECDINPDNTDSEWGDLQGDHQDDEETIQMDSTIERNGCLSHLLQLAVKDAFSECTLATELIQKVNRVVNFFHKSNFWYNQLKEKVNNLCC